MIYAIFYDTDCLGYVKTKEEAIKRIFNRVYTGNEEIIDFGDFSLYKIIKIEEFKEEE